MGDFNTVRDPSKRVNSVFNDSCAQSFNAFIHLNGLLEYTMHGNLFTYVSDNGIKKSNLERILVSPDFMDAWPEAALTALPRSLSDHHPINLATTSLDFGPSPFRFFNSWLSKPGIDDVVSNSLSSGPFWGRPNQILNLKLKHLKSELKTWLNNLKATETAKKIALDDQLESLDTIIDHRDYTDDELALWIDTKEKLITIEHSITKDLHQKSRAKWVSCSDENSRYFHRFINCRKARNIISGLDINGNWHIDPPSIRQVALTFFSNKLREPINDRPKIHCLGLKTLSPDDANLLISPFTLKEIIQAVWDCDSDKAPGPDGLILASSKDIGTT
uniref:uncharacterized protein LOC122610815 n=1 Tax=Erigeron canadensis TaxID=72917 RepID=UPI001CB8FB90|nr:uncharacterized protein LOC122610815 [Erigeron canadensis]